MRPLLVSCVLVFAALMNPTAFAGSGSGTLTTSTGKCLVAQSNANGANVLIHDCFQRSVVDPDARPTAFVSQGWRFDDQGRVVADGGKCLDVVAQDFGINGARVQLWDCHSGQNQKWWLSGTRLRLKATTKCLEVFDAEAAANNGRVRLWECAVEPNQVWNVSPQPSQHWCGSVSGREDTLLPCQSGLACKRECRVKKGKRGKGILECSGPKLCLP